MASAPKLYINAICPFAQRAWITARLKNAPVVLEHISLTDMPKWYIETINPRHTVPAMVAADGQKVYESLFIAEYLDAQYGLPYELFPRNAQLRADVRFFLDEAGNLTGTFYRTLAAEEAKVAEATSALHEALAKVEALLVKQSAGPFFLGAKISLADVAVLPFFLRFAILLKHFHDVDIFAAAPRLKALYEAGLQVDAVASTTPSAAQLLSAYTRYAKGPLRVPLALPELYVAATCPFAHRARLAQAISKVPVKRVVIDLEHPPANLAALNPRETVPFIVQPDGKRVFESMFVAKYLAEQRNEATDFLDGAGGAALMPSTPQEVHDADFFVDDFPSSTLWQVLGAGAAGRAEAVKAARESLAAFEKRVRGPFALGAKVSFADVAVAPFLLRLEALPLLAGAEADVLSAAPKLQGLLGAVRALDGAAADIETKEFYAESLRRFVE